MDDDKIKGLFDSFDPALPPTRPFMERVRQNLEAVEMIRERQRAQRKRSEKAVAIGSLAGFAAGMLFSKAIPYIGEATGEIMQHTPDGTFLHMLAGNYLPLSWLVIAAITVFTAINAYDLSLALLKPGDSGSNSL